MANYLYPAIGSGGGGGGGLTVQPGTVVGDFLKLTGATEVGSLGLGIANTLAIWTGANTQSANPNLTINPLTAVLQSFSGYAVIGTLTVTRYVDPVGGNNANTGLSAPSAWADINYALSQAPLLLTGIYRIEVAAGTLSQNILTTNFIGKANDATYGGSVIYINGAGVGVTNLTSVAGANITHNNNNVSLVLDNLTFQNTAAQTGIRAINSNLFLRDVNFDSCIQALSFSGARVLWDGSGPSTISNNVNNCINTANGSSLIVSKSLTFTNFATIAIAANSYGFVILSGSAYNFTGAGGGAAAAFQPSTGATISIGTVGGAINVTNVISPYKSINGGVIFQGSANTITLTNCTGGWGQVSEDSFFGEVLANTYIAAGTTPTSYVTEGTSYFSSPSSIFDTSTGWTRLYNAFTTEKFGTDFRYKSYAQGLHVGALPAGATNYFSLNGLVSTIVPLKGIDAIGHIDFFQVISRVGNGAAHTDTYTVFVNGVATALVVAITNGTTGSATSPEILVNAGDYVSVRCVSDAATAAQDVYVQVGIRRS